MIEIKNQLEFDSLVSNTSTTDMIKIYPKEDGTPYTLLNPWVISSNTHVEGMNNPKIEFIGDYTSTVVEEGIIRIKGILGTEVENVKIRGIHLIGKNTVVGWLSGIYVENCGLAQTTGTTAYDSTTIGNAKINKVGIEIKNCIIEKCKRYGIHLVKSYNCKIDGNTIQNNGIGIYFQVSSNNTIIRNIIQNNSNVGIHLISSSNNTITGNTVQNNNSNGIYLNSSSNNIITGNTIQNNNSTGILINSSASINNSIVGNTVQNNIDHGIYLVVANNNTITGNTVQGNSNCGIILNNAPNNTIASNTVQNNNGYGIYFNSLSNNNIVYANVTLNNTNGAVSNSGTGNECTTTYNKFIS